MQWIILGVFVLITVVLLSGKGGWLIAGYNTMSKVEKAKYDEKKLCRRVGLMLLVIDLALLITNIIMSTQFGVEHESNVGLSAAGLIIITVGFGIVFVNKGTKKK